VALSGTGIAAIYSASPTSLAFGNETTNVASAPKSVTVTNTGTVALPITSITLSTTGSQPFSQTNNCGTSVAVGATCTISVVFDPASAESATATLSVNAGNGAGAQIVALSGTGIATLPTTTVSSSNSGGGALDAISLLSLLAMFGLQQRRRINARTRVTARRFASAGAGGRNDVFVMQAARQDYG
jgi:predicted RecA/RadA family phage recombinase